MKKNKFKTIFAKFDEKRSVSHPLFLKQHKIREEISERPSDLTLFVCNVPPYCTEESLKCLFGEFGSIKSVSFANTDVQNKVIQNNVQVSVPNTVKGYKTGYAVFNSAASLQNVLALEEGTTLSNACSQKALTTGLKKWCAAYNANFPDPVTMQKEIDSYMAKQDENEAQTKCFAKSVAESDEDGWISVSRSGSRNPGFARKQSVKDNVVRKMMRKKKKRALLNFYSFQIKESKMNHLITLRKKFEDDKKKVETLKTQRKFKPF